MTQYELKKQRLEQKQAQREFNASPESKKAMLFIVLFVVMWGGLMISDITAGEMIGYMIGFSIIMLPITMFVGTLKILK